jgi:hypothetical protein
MTGSRGKVIPSTLPHANIRDALAPLTGGTEKGTFIPVTFAVVPEARDAMDVRYKQLVANFLLDGETVTPFGGGWDAGVCMVETMFKEIANRSLGAKHALWKGDLWLADDLMNDNYFTALDARAELEANRFAVNTGSYAYWDKRWSASVNTSSVIADLTYTNAKQKKARSDLYSKSGHERRIKLELVEPGVRPVLFSGPVLTHQRPTQPAHLLGNGRRDELGSADFWRRSGLQEAQTTQEDREHRRAQPSDRPGRAQSDCRSRR